MASGSSFGTGPYDAILDIATAIVASGSVETSLQTITENVARAMFSEAASLGTYYADKNEFIHEAEWREGGLKAAQRSEIGRVVNLTEEPELRAVLEGRRVREYHIDDPSLSPMYRDYLTRRGLKTGIDCPLVFGSKVIGLLGLEESRFVRRFTASEQTLFTRLCELAAIGIHTARQTRRVQELERQVADLKRGGAPSATV